MRSLVSVVRQLELELGRLRSELTAGQHEGRSCGQAEAVPGEVGLAPTCCFVAGRQSSGGAVAGSLKIQSKTGGKAAVLHLPVPCPHVPASPRRASVLVQKRV